MDSSFLTALNVSLGLFSAFLFVRMLILFGMPNHPARLIAYIVSFCVAAYFCLQAATDFRFIAPWIWLKWRSLPMIAGSLSLLLQIIMMMGQYSLLQQKVISRLPLIGGLICFSFFPSKADIFLGAILAIAAAFLTIMVGKARYQKRLFYKMLLFTGISFGFKMTNIYWLFLVGHGVLFIVLFYLFLFQQSFGISALVDDYRHSAEEELP